ncbi:uncharacterized protein LOC117342396 [Pecten maximus]|uniref:uncharacterized protein LOC117342396 n=1 Tax=Pecten maximus TaxID=6579 RepID=UPI001458761F|nr:uncharacterized protein LOC117342396 [Pecten maximus]
MSGIRKQNANKSVAEQNDEWLTTRNKRKAPPSQRPLKKHKAYSGPLRESTRENQLFLLTQNSPPPPQLKTCTKQSDIKSFFKSPNLTDHPDKEKFPVRSLFEDEISNHVICSSDDSDDENVKENLNICGKGRSRLLRSPTDKGDNSASKQIQDRKGEDSKLQQVLCVENESTDDFLHKGEDVINSPTKRTDCGILTEQYVKFQSKMQRRVLIQTDPYRDKSVPSTNMNSVQMPSMHNENDRFYKGRCETDPEQECLKQEKKLCEEDSEASETEISFRNCQILAANRNSKEKLLTCDRSTCKVCCDYQTESLTFTCENQHSTDTDPSNHSRLINSEEADQELENFSLSLNTQYT